MSMMECTECKGQISTTARTCPSCGAKVPHTKWWLWIPLGLIAAFLLYGAMIPEYVSRARETRQACEAIAPLNKDECWRIYNRLVAEGEASAHPRSNGNAETPADVARRQKEAETQAAADMLALNDCKATISARIGEYRRLMASRDYWTAVLAVRRCSQLLDDQQLKALVADGEIKQYVRDIENAQNSAPARIQAIQALNVDYPDRGKKYAKLLAKLTASAERDTKH